MDTTTTSNGIDYGNGQTNLNTKTKIRYGIIPLNALNDFALEAFEPNYGNATCGTCGNDAVEYDENKHNSYEAEGGRFYDYACESCKIVFSCDDAFPESPLSWTIQNEDETGFMDEYNDVWITDSPWYTLCAFASPCAPGAGYLTSKGTVKTYCLGFDWFDKDNPCQYKIYSVADDSEVQS